MNNQKTNQPNIHLTSCFIQNHEDVFSRILHGVQWDERMKARKTASFGVSYDYSNITYPARAMPPELAKICDRIEQLLGFRPNNCLINYYPDGQSTMGFHSDSTEALVGDTGVVIVSLGVEREICYRSKLDPTHKVCYSLEPGSLLYMDQLVQAEWMHAIPKSNAKGARISLTFRCMCGIGKK